jgi:hypothetical protein
MFTVWLGQVTGIHAESVPGLACLALLALGLGGLYLWSWLGRSAFLEARVEALGPLTQGGRLSARLVLCPKRPLTLVPGGSSVLVFTRKDWGDDSSRVYEHRQPLDLPTHLLHRHEQRFEIALRPGIPPTSGPQESNGFFAPATERFASELHVTVAIEHWPDLVVRTPVQVPSATSSAKGIGRAR